MTEDSDLIAYGVTKLLYKLDNDGKGYELNTSKLFEEGDSFSDKIQSSQELTENGEIKEIEIIDIDDDFDSSQKIEGIDADSSSKHSDDSSNKNLEESLVFKRSKFL